MANTVLEGLLFNTARKIESSRGFVLLFIVKMPSILDTCPAFRTHVDNFRNKAQDFISYYPEDDEYRQVCICITSVLLNISQFSINDDQHPFQRFACGEEDHSTHLQRLKSTIEYYLNTANPHIRSVILAFFAPQGSQRDALDELMYDYYRMVDEIIDDLDGDLST